MNTDIIFRMKEWLLIIEASIIRTITNFVRKSIDKSVDIWYNKGEDSLSSVNTEKEKWQ